MVMRTIATTLTALALAATLSACGGGADSGAPAVNTEVANLAKTIGDNTVEKNSAHLVFSGNAGGQQVNGEGDMQFGDQDTAVRMDMTTPAGPMTIVLTDGQLYLKPPNEVEPGKTWVKVDSNSKDPMAKALGSITQQLRNNADPRRTLAQFQTAGTITATKSEQLNGVPTTHHTITVDVRKLAEAQQDPTFKKAMTEAIDGGLADFPVDVWLDGEDLPVRIALAMPTPDPASGKTIETTVQVDYSAWGAPVTIDAPPADQVTGLPT
jgi:hypothetical protein